MNLIEKNTILINDKIWKIIESEASSESKIFIEIRNIEKKEMSIYSYHFESNTYSLVFEKLDWWLSIQYANNSVVIFQYFDPEKMPYSSKILAYSIQNQNIIWEIDNAFYVSTFNNDKKYVLINRTQFEIQKTIIIDSENGNEIIDTMPLENKLQKKIILYKEEDKYFTDLQSFISQITNHTAIKLIEYCEWQCFILISYYICRSENSFENYLLIINEKGGLHLSETLGTSLKGVATGTFSVYNNYLYFVNTDNQIKILALNDK